MMQILGDQLTHLDIRGSIMCTITDSGAESISTYCNKLEMLGVSVLKNITGKHQK